MVGSAPKNAHIIFNVALSVTLLISVYIVLLGEKAVTYIAD